MLCGIAAPLFFIASFTIQGLFRKEYSALCYPISSLSIGQHGWVQIATFLITGLLLLLFSIVVQHTLHNKLLTVLFVLVAIGLIGSGIFKTDPVFGYPPDKPFINNVFTLHGKLHTLFSLLVFIGLPFSCFIMARHFHLSKKKLWKYYTFSTGIIMPILFFLTAAAFTRHWGLGPIAGLLQRLCIISGFTWIVFLACYLNNKKFN